MCIRMNTAKNSNDVLTIFYVYPNQTASSAVWFVSVIVCSFAFQVIPVTAKENTFDKHGKKM